MSRLASRGLSHDGILMATLLDPPCISASVAVPRRVSGPLPNSSARCDINATPSYRPDGSKIVYASQPNDGSNEWDIWVMNPDGSGKENVLADDEWQDLQPAWSPDGKQITFVSNRSEIPGTDLFVVGYRSSTTSSGATLSSSPRLSSSLKRATAGALLIQDTRPIHSHVKRVTRTGSSLAPDWGRKPQR